MCNCNKPTRPPRPTNNNSRQIIRFVPSPPPTPVNLGMAPQEDLSNISGGEPINSERRRIDALKRKAAIQKHLGR